MSETRIHFNSASEREIENLLRSRSDFVMDADRGDLMQACAKIEKCCDNCGYSSRVSTKGAVVGSIAPGILSGGLGFLGLAVGKVAHLVATFNPDYEIDRNIITNTVTVTYKK